MCVCLWALCLQNRLTYDLVVHSSHIQSVWTFVGHSYVWLEWTLYILSGWSWILVYMTVWVANWTPPSSGWHESKNRILPLLTFWTLPKVVNVQFEMQWNAWCWSSLYLWMMILKFFMNLAEINGLQESWHIDWLFCGNACNHIVLVKLISDKKVSEFQQVVSYVYQKYIW